MRKTARLIVEERWPDWRYGIRTSGITMLDGLEVDGANKSRGCRYEAVNRSAFEAALKLLPEPPREFAFIDLGSGRGFALLLAAASGFARLIGVEFADALVADARKNLQTMMLREAGLPPWEILHQDLSVPALPDRSRLHTRCDHFRCPVVLRLWRSSISWPLGFR